MEFEGEHFQLTNYEINKTVKAFRYLDKKKNGSLKLDLLGDLMRCCGYNISLKEIEDIKRLIVEGKVKEKENKREAEIKEKRIDDETNEEKNEEKTTLASDKDVKSKREISESGGTNDDENNLSKLLSDLKNYDNFMEIEKKKKELEKIEEENKSLFCIKEYFRVIQTPDIMKNIKPPAVLAAFENFDTKGNGKISIKRFRFILQHLGEPFSDAELDELFEWIRKLDMCKDEEIVYEDLLNELINKDTSI